MTYFQAISRHKYEATPLPHPQQPEHKVPSNYQFLPAQKNLTHPEYRSLNLSSESNIYSSVGRWDDAAQIRSIQREIKRDSAKSKALK